MSMTPQTGEIKAWVGGIDYKNFKYDMVKTGERQIGSTFKPFVYATAIDQMHMSGRMREGKRRKEIGLSCESYLLLDNRCSRKISSEMRCPQI